jgi:hypothetical protein
MLLIQHRINTLKQLKKTDTNYGIEIDVRSNKSRLFLHHDPFNQGPSLDKFLKFYNHKLLIVNVKEEGIELKILKILKKNKVKNYFLLDVTIPQLVRLAKFEKKIAFRVSRYENITEALKFKKILKWIWLDTFNGKLPISFRELRLLKNYNFKICLVSPELPMKKILYLKKMKKKISMYRSYFDAVCTKYPSIWK